MAPEGTQWPKRPESAAFDVIREQVGDNAHGPLVVARIKEQYRRGNTPVPSRLDALEQPAARTVTTGHQLCIAGGPAFTYYKIQTAISLAARLERRWGVPVLPVFWLASEDHDFEEVSKVWDGDGWRAWAPEGNGQGAVGRMATTGLPSVLSDWAEHVGVSSAVAQELASVGKANLADAMRHWVHMMFGQDQVIVLDGDDPDLKAAFVPVMEQEVVSAITEEEVTRCDAILHAEGTSPQVHVRSCNLFHLTANGRYRLVQEDGHWKALGGGQTWANTAALTAEMRADPAAFSPNALLRPVYQSHVLPDVATVGGMAEVAYWLQLSGLYARLGMAQPALVPRDGAIVLPQRWAQLKQRMAIADADLGARLDQWESGWVSGAHPPEVDAWRQSMRTEAEAARLDFGAVDASLEGSIKATRAKMEALLDRLEQQGRKAVKRKEEGAMERLARLHHWVNPNGKPQERTCHFWQLAAEWDKQSGGNSSLEGAIEQAMEEGHEGSDWRPLLHVLHPDSA